jgi:hypothetical protein
MPSPHYRFDGTNDYIAVPSLGLLANYSISAFLRYESDGYYKVIYATNSTECWFGIGSSSAEGSIRWHIGGSDRIDTANGVLSQNTWHHVVGTWDGTNGKIYVDGVEIGTTTTGTLNNAASESSSTIGSSSGRSGNWWLGDIGSVSLWNIALSASEVKDLYSGGATLYKYQGANNTNLTSGTLVKGKAYKIVTYNSNDDFTNLGASSNASGVTFISTGTTPTEWNHSSVLIPIGCVAEFDGTGVASDKWLDKSGNDSHGTVTGATVVNAPSGDDGLVYEEGVHEVTMNAQTSGSWEVSSTDKYLSYVRIGNLVHVTGYLNAVNKLSANGNILISLPYASATGLTGGADIQWGFGSVSHQGSTVSGMTSIAYVPENQSYFLLAYVQDDGTYSYFSDGNLDDNFYVRVGFSYRI